ncbi:MAG: cyclic nucleotide-binding domain-containing protein [Clostridiales bacterium]|nr:cyclic nucleotide-binding domain-containing protein [Clostridiales bacterium]
MENGHEIFQHDIFQYLPEGIAETLPTVRVNKDTVFIPAEAQEVIDLYYILDGEVSVFAQSHNGREFLIDTLPSGNFIGKFSQMRNQNFYCEVRANCDCRLLVLTRYKEFLLSDKSFALYFYIKTTDRVYEMYKLSMARTLYSYDELFAYWLLKLADDKRVVACEDELIRLKMNISERQFFYLLKKLGGLKLIRRARNKIQLLDEDGLRDLAQNVCAFMDSSY